MKCIYCLEDKGHQYFLNREHVMPESFGHFKENLTLKNIVCDCCNEYFGKYLERYLARDTLEGIYRFKFGIKRSEEFKSVGKRSRIRRTITEGQFKGADTYLEYSEDQDKLVLKQVPQIGFRKRDSSEYEYFLLEDVPDKTALEQRGFDLNHPQGFMIPYQYRSHIEKILLEKGITRIIFEGETAPVKQNEIWRYKVEATVDNTIRRAIAKIAFNYLAFWENRDFVLHTDFDIIRKFIRYDEIPPYPIFLIDNKTILQDEQDKRRRIGHIITLDYASDGKSILSQISIFNLISSYKICFARDFSGPLTNLRRGHFFNIHDMKIWPLEAR